MTGAPSPSAGAGRPVRLFLSYAREDEKYCDQLRAHLAYLSRAGVIEVWHDRRVLPGDEWDPEIREQLAAAEVFLFLVSAYLLNSDYVQKDELPLAIARHEHGTGRIVPILVRPCVFEGTPLARFQAVPRGARPVASWANRDDAWKDVAKNIERVCRALRGETVGADESGPDLVPAGRARPRRWTAPVVAGLGALPLLALGSVAAQAGAAIGLPLLLGTLTALAAIGALLAVGFGGRQPFRRRWRRLPVLAPLALLAWAALLVAPRLTLVRVFNDTRETVALGASGALAVPPGASGVSWAAAAALEPSAWNAWLSVPGAAACASAVAEEHPGHCADAGPEDAGLLSLLGVPRLYVGCRRYERLPAGALLEPDAGGAATAIEVRGADCEPLRPVVKFRGRWLLGALDGVAAPAIPWCRDADGTPALVPEDATVEVRLPAPGLYGADGHPPELPGELTHLCLRDLKGTTIAWRSPPSDHPVVAADLQGSADAVRAAVWQDSGDEVPLTLFAGAEGGVRKLTCRPSAARCRDVAPVVRSAHPLQLEGAAGATFESDGIGQLALGCWPAACEGGDPPFRGPVTVGLRDVERMGGVVMPAPLTVSTAVREYRFALAGRERLRCELAAGGHPGGWGSTALSVRLVAEDGVDRQKMRAAIETTHEGITWRSTWTGPDGTDPWVCHAAGAEPPLPLLEKSPGGGEGAGDDRDVKPPPPACYIFKSDGAAVDEPGDYDCTSFGAVLDCTYRGKTRRQRRHRCE